MRKHVVKCKNMGTEIEFVGDISVPGTKPLANRLANSVFPTIPQDWHFTSF